MSAAVPTIVPLSLAAGDTATWRVCLPDYSAADGWALSYIFMRHDTGAKITIAASASGTDFLVNEPAETTAAWVAGKYEGHAYVSKSPDRFKVWQGPIEILPDFSEATDRDSRTIARKTLDALEAAILTLSTAQSSGRSGSITEWTVEGLHIKRASPELLFTEIVKQRDRYATIVSIEEAKARVAMGRPSGRRILIRFR